MFDDIEQVMKGYSKEDEFIARDLLIIELLIDKKIITVEEVNKKYEKLYDKIQKVKNDRQKDLEKRIKELREKKGSGVNE